MRLIAGLFSKASTPRPLCKSGWRALPLAVLASLAIAHPPVATAQDATARERMTESAPPRHRMGMEIPVGNFVYFVHAARYAKQLGNSAVNGTAAGTFLLVTMSARNTGTTERTIDASIFTIKDARGKEFGLSQRGDTALRLSGGKPLSLRQCPPGTTAKGVLVFEVPARDAHVLVVSGGLWSGQDFEIPLQ